MMVGTKAIATLSTGYLNALEYAKERVQGADLTQLPTRPRRGSPSPTTRTCAASLMTQKAYAEGMRALVLYTASRAGRALLAAAAGGEPDEAAERPQRPAAADRQGLRLGEVATSCSPSRCRPSAAPATCRTTRSSSTSATPRSTPSTRAPRRSRAWTSSSARSSATRAQALTAVSGEIQEFVEPVSGGDGLAGRARAARPGGRRPGGHRRQHGRRPRRLGRAGRQEHLQGRASTPPGC